jgi:SAM-dependent methyltransferase
MINSSGYSQTLNYVKTKKILLQVSIFGKTLVMTKSAYVHGYSAREAVRLNDQADTLDELLHYDTLFKQGELVLEAGCGVGAQTKIIAPKNPETHFIAVDLSSDSLVNAKKLIESMHVFNVEFQQADIFKLPFNDNTFDGIFICFVLEHLHTPSIALQELKRVLKKNGTIMVIEGDHGSTFFYPDSRYAHMAIDCQVKLQKKHGGNCNIGRELYPLLNTSGFKNIHVSPRMVYVDASRPRLVNGFTRNTFTAMIEGVGPDAVRHGLIDHETFHKGIDDLYRTAEDDGVFSYTFFKATATK